MASFRTEVAHQLGKDEAKRRLESLIDQVSRQFKEQVTQLQSDWQDYILRFAISTFGVQISGTLTVDDALARVEGTLPLAAMMFKGKIEQTIKSELARELS